MAKTAKTKVLKATEQAARPKSARACEAKTQDAIALLEAGDREVDALFDNSKPLATR
jgi:hypothetical protein